MNHHHCGCEHALKYCRVCDVVYCEKCGKEWRYPGYTISTWTTPTVQWDTRVTAGTAVYHSHEG